MRNVLYVGEPDYERLILTKSSTGRILMIFAFLVNKFSGMVLVYSIFFYGAELYNYEREICNHGT